MKRIAQLLVVAAASVAVTITGLQAGSTSQGEKPKPSASESTTSSLTVEGGEPSGNYVAGSLVIVTADAPPIGAQFAGWTGDVAILANPSLPKTTATIPYMTVTISATYTAPVIDVFGLLNIIWGG
jgi:Divergent InlB B-repeat domain